MPKPKSNLKKVTIRLPEGLPEKLTELFQMPYNQVIRLALGKLVRAKMEEADLFREAAVQSDHELVASIDAALARDESLKT